MLHQKIIDILCTYVLNIRNLHFITEIVTRNTQSDVCVYGLLTNCKAKA